MVSEALFLKDMKKIYAVIVTYNFDEDRIIELTEFLKDKVEKTIICNNSENLKFLKLKSNKKLEINELLYNYGLPYGQNIGINQAFNDGAEFVLLLDQDSWPEDNLVSELLNSYNYLSTIYKVGIIGSKYYDKNSKSLSSKRFYERRKLINSKYMEVSEVISSGSLIPKNTFYTYGKLEEQFFIDFVDFEYCWRVRKNGCKIFLINSSKIYHEIGQGTKSILGLKIVLSNPVRYYYYFRNLIVLLKRNYVPLAWKIKNFLRIFFLIFVVSFTFKNKLSYLEKIFKGIYHGIIEKLGKFNEN